MLVPLQLQIWKRIWGGQLKRRDKNDWQACFTFVLHDLHPINARGLGRLWLLQSKCVDDYVCVEWGRICSNSHVVRIPFSSRASVKLFLILLQFCYSKFKVLNRVSLSWDDSTTILQIINDYKIHQKQHGKGETELEKIWGFIPAGGLKVGHFVLCWYQGGGRRSRIHFSDNWDWEDAAL